MARGERIANRRIVTTVLKRSLALDLAVTACTLHRRRKWLVLCAGQAAYVFSIEDQALRTKMGKERVGVKQGVKGTFTCCAINDAATHIAVGARDDPKISVFSVKTGKIERSFEKHVGGVYQVQFTVEGGRVLSSGEDGCILVWDCRSGKIHSRFMRHPSAVRCFEMPMSQQERVIAGRADGALTVWDRSDACIIDRIEPEPEFLYPRSENPMTPSAWDDPEKYHSAGIMCLRRSGDGKLLATGSSDNTCKIWNATSYLKPIGVVRRDREVRYSFAEVAFDSPDSSGNTH